MTKQQGYSALCGLFLACSLLASMQPDKNLLTITTSLLSSIAASIYGLMGIFGIFRKEP